jgi:hypothetical protein
MLNYFMILYRVRIPVTKDGLAYTDVRLLISNFLEPIL